MAAPQVSKKGTAFGQKKEDYENLRVEGVDLRWHGKKLRTVGWSRAEIISVVAIIVAGTIASLSNLDKIKNSICSMSGAFCAPESSAGQKTIAPSTSVNRPDVIPAQPR